MTWHVVHFRKNVQLVEDAELERMKARKVPKLLHHELAAIYTCGVCGQDGPWISRHWRWWGSAEDLEAGRSIEIYCSSSCAPTRKPVYLDGGYSVWRKTPGYKTHEPVVHVEGADRRSIIDAANPRLFPAPVWPKERSGNGWCKWCGERVTEPGRRTWHAKCVNQFFLHTRLEFQRDFLIARDGEVCATCPPGYGKWIDAGPFARWQRAPGHHIKWSQELQVDHIVPLWSVLSLPDDERRFYFGPPNLWLLCSACHIKKTTLEAADRAAAL